MRLVIVCSILMPARGQLSEQRSTQARESFSADGTKIEALACAHLDVGRGLKRRDLAVELLADINLALLDLFPALVFGHRVDSADLLRRKLNAVIQGGAALLSGEVGFVNLDGGGAHVLREGWRCDRDDRGGGCENVD